MISKNFEKNQSKSKSSNPEKFNDILLWKFRWPVKERTNTWEKEEKENKNCLERTNVGIAKSIMELLNLTSDINAHEVRVVLFWASAKLNKGIISTI